MSGDQTRRMHKCNFCPAHEGSFVVVVADVVTAAFCAATAAAAVADVGTAAEVTVMSVLAEQNDILASCIHGRRQQQQQQQRQQRQHREQHFVV